MQSNDLFIDSKIPKPLKKEEIYDYFEKMKHGDITAREKIINHNIRLVINEVIKKFSNSPYELKELVSIGLIGLVKSVDTFDITKGLQFATYSIRCIDNEILMFMRKGKKYINDTSLEQQIGTDKEGKELRIEDTLSDINSDFAKEYEVNESYKVIRKVVDELPERDKNIVIKHFGFKDNNPMTQKEIANELGLSQSYVSKIIKRVLKDISVQLKVLGIIEVTLKQKNENKGKSVKGVEKMSKKLQTIYEYFNNYTKEQVNEMLSKLNEEEKELITIRYGKDLDNPISTILTQEQTNKFYGTLVPKMRRLLVNPNSKNRAKKVKEQSKDLIVESSSQSSIGLMDAKAKVGVSINLETPTLEKEEIIELVKQPKKSMPLTNTENDEITKGDYIKMLDLLKTPKFNEILSGLSVKESVIVYLKLGFIDEKYFTIEAISQFLGIDEKEVIEITKKALSLYKDNLNKFVDKAVEYATDQHSQNVLNKKIN